MSDSPLRREPTYFVVAIDRLLEPAPAELEQSPVAAGQELQLPEAEFTGEMVCLAGVLEAILITPLSSLDGRDGDQRVAGQISLPGRERQVECLAAVRQRLSPPASLTI